MLREGEVRYTWKASQTTTPAYALSRFTFTGQYSHIIPVGGMDDPSTSGVTEGFGLMFYNARWYDPALGRFAQPDTIIPEGQGTQAWDRFAYVNNNPVRYMDPSGHCAWDLCIGEGIVLGQLVVDVITIVVGIGLIANNRSTDKYISTNTENKTNQLIESFGRNGDDGGWNLCPNAKACLIGATVLASVFYKMATTGACGEDETNCVVLEPTPPTPTATSTSTPTLTSTSTSTPTPTATSTSTPTLSPTPLPMPRYYLYEEYMAY